MDAGLDREIAENIDKIKSRIDKAAKRSGRDSDQISLIAVTKKKSALTIKALVENGVNKIGESYLQEAIFKIDLLADLDIEWHMVGNIQRGKEKQVAGLFHTVHSVGALRTALELNLRAAEYNRVLSVYLEVNCSGEATKHGWRLGGQDSLEELHRDIEEIIDCQNLKILGLMTMAPYSTDPEDSRPYFRRMRETRDMLKKSFPESDFVALSMGMSGDFEVAIEEGATAVRIGTALVGPR